MTTRLTTAELRLIKMAAGLIDQVSMENFVRKALLQRMQSDPRFVEILKAEGDPFDAKSPEHTLELPAKRTRPVVLS